MATEAPSGTNRSTAWAIVITLDMGSTLTRRERETQTGPLRPVRGLTGRRSAPSINPGKHFRKELRGG